MRELAIKAVVSIAGMIVGFVSAMLSCELIYDLIWPGATDKQEGGVGYFFFFMLAPAFMLAGAIVGPVLYGRFLKRR